MNIYNITALTTLNKTNKNNKASLEKLSSGLRINRAADDASGLAISEKMRGQIRGLNQAAQNIQDGISLIQTAEGAMQEIHAILQRMNEIAVQAANGTLNDSDRTLINEEFMQLKEAIHKVSKDTEFNGINILNGGKEVIESSTKITWEAVESGSSTNFYDVAWNGSQFLAVGKNGNTLASTDGVTWYVPHSPVTNVNLNSVKAANGKFIITEGSHILITTDGYDRIAYGSVPSYNGRYFDANYVGGKYIAVGENGQIAITIDPFNGNREWTGVNSGTTEKLYSVASSGNEYIVVGENGTVLRSTDAVTWTSQSPNVTAGLTSVIWENGKYVASGRQGTILTSVDGISWTDVSIPSGMGTIQNMIYSNNEYIAITDGGTIFRSPDGDTWETERLSDAGITQGIAWNGESYLVVGYNGKILKGTYEQSITKEKHKINLQVGANANQSFELILPDTQIRTLGLENIVVDSQKNSEIAIEMIKSAIDKVSADRSLLGAYQNRLEHTMNNVMNYSENLTNAESRIRDVDIAKEMMEFTKSSILFQATQAMLAQANQKSEEVLQLIKL